MGVSCPNTVPELQELLRKQEKEIARLKQENTTQREIICALETQVSCCQHKEAADSLCSLSQTSKRRRRCGGKSNRSEQEIDPSASLPTLTLSQRTSLAAETCPVSEIETANHLSLCTLGDDSTVGYQQDLNAVEIKPYPIASSSSHQASSSSSYTEHSVHSNTPTCTFSAREAAEELQRWLFLEGGHLCNVQELIVAYSTYVREQLGLPLDRLFIGGLMLHPQISAYVWKWEKKADAATPMDELDEHEIPRDIFAKRFELFSEDEPFMLLMGGRATSVRMRPTDKHIPKDCQWFIDEKYQDYLALPILHRQKFMGGMAFSTKCAQGFHPEHIKFFEQSQAALTTIMRLHTNDLVLTTLKSRLEEEVAERTQDLEQANQRILQQSAAQLTSFAMCSHEIRTPLNCIIGLSSLLVDTELDESQQESLRMIVRSGDLLLNVVNDVLDYSRLESGMLDINFAPTELKGVVDLVLHSMAAKARARKIKIRKTMDKEIPDLVNTDGSRLQQILYNLIGNSCKFSREEGTVEFSLHIVTKKNQAVEEEKEIQFKVKDWGKGIAKKDLANIFKPFHQGTGPTSRVYGGTGLGLAITSKLVKGLGGDISVDSVLGEWTEFVVTLPCQELQANQIQQDPAAEHESGMVFGRADSIRSNQSSESASSTGCNDNGSPSSGLTTPESAVKQPHKTKRPSASVIKSDTRILVVDDNAVNRKVLVRMLDRLGAKHVDTAKDGVEACEMEEKHDYSLVLMDLEMPKRDGLEATRMILARSNREAEKPAPKVVFVTAHALDAFHAKAFAAGASGFLTKPFNLDKLTSLFNSVDLHLGCRQIPSE